MAGAVAARVSRASAPEAIETDLAALWRGLAQAGPVARAVMSNLVVFREGRGAGRTHVDDLLAGLPVDEVVARHPSRIIAIVHDPRRLGTPATAAVAIVTFGAEHARYGVEEIAIQSGCDEAALPSIVRRFLRGDLPTSVWWTEDLSRVPPMAALVGMGRQLVYDSRGWSDVREGVRALAHLIVADGERRRIDLADVNWRRLTALRQALVFAADTGGAPWSSANVRIAHGGNESALAWLLVGWLTAQLGWSSPPVVQETDGGDVLSVVIRDSTTEVAARLDDRRAVLSRGSDAPAVFRVSGEGEADAVAAELRSLSHDVCLHDALSALVRTFSAA